MIKEKKRGKHLVEIVIVLLIIVGGFYLLNKQITGNITLSGFAIKEYYNETGFDAGTYSNTEYSADYVELSSGQDSGTYTSEVFNAGSESSWNNISWTSSAIGDLPDDGESDGFGSGNADMSDIFVLMHLDETSANSSEGGSDFEDTSGNSHHGNESGGVTFNADGKFGKAASFDGTDDVINLGDLDMDGWSNLSVASWINTSSTDTMRIVSKDQVGVKGNWILWFIQGVWKFQVYEGNDNWAIAQYSSTSINDGEWHHIAGKISVDDDKIKLFVDGALVAQDDFSGTLDDSQGEELVIGADSDLGAVEQVFNGVIDEVAIWNREISADEIADLYKRGITRLNLTARSCDDENCSGESFDDIDDESPQNLSLDDNQYFQYKFDFDTDSSSFSPELYNVTIDYDNANSAPDVVIYMPSDGLLYLTNESLTLNYTATDINGNLDSCWYNLDNGSNTTIAGCLNTTFNTSEGSHTLYMYANDTNGSIGSDSVSFNVDPTGVSVSIIQPTGTKTSRTDIPLNYSTIGNNLTCWYEVKTSIGGSVISNTTLANCTNTNFDVSTDGDYVAYLYSNNTFGTSGSDSSGFSVDTDTNGNNEDDDDSSGGSSGGSGGYSITREKLEITGLPSLILRPGDKKKLILSVKNTGIVFLNNCVLQAKKDTDYENWVNNEASGAVTVVKDLAVGEVHEFIFTLNIPEDLQSGVYPVEILINCEEMSQNSTFNVEILDNTLDFKIVKVDKTDKDNFKIIYTLESLSEKDQNLDMHFTINNEEGSKLWEGQESGFLPANFTQEFEISFPSDVAAESKDLKLVVEINSELTSFVAERDLVLGSENSISGFSIFDSGFSDDTVTWFAIIFFALFAGFIVFRIFQNEKSGK